MTQSRNQSEVDSTAEHVFLIGLPYARLLSKEQVILGATWHTFVHLELFYLVNATFLETLPDTSKCAPVSVFLIGGAFPA